ncbi:recombinase family protein [Streptomyces sanyensis]|uniref:recombinase family protein n=1 Tax=Streptomyces sanyensis TaxID=568869 RepID=UPI003D789619
MPSIELGRQIISCFVYARISSDREGAGLGVQRQVEDCEELARQLSTGAVEYRVVRVFQDNDLSAYSGKPRPDYTEMLQALRDGEGDCVLAWHTDRLHRRPLELEEYIDVCEPRRVDTRTVKAGHLDLSTATGRMIARQLGVQARYEVERMVERQRRKRDEMAKNGVHFGGRRPFGWEVDGMTPIEFEVECIQDAARAVLAGASLRSIAAGWNARGIKTSTGHEWTGAELGSMLRRPRNAGIFVHRGEEVGAAQWPAALDEPTWRSLVAFLSDPSRWSSPRNERKYLGSAIYLCGVCADGTTMRSGTSNARNGGVGRRMWSVYRCRSGKHLSRRQDLLDDHVQLTVLDRLSRPDAAEWLAHREEPVDVRGAQEVLRQARATLDDWPLRSVRESWTCARTEWRRRARRSAWRRLRRFCRGR